jgi:hypothetical protein
VIVLPGNNEAVQSDQMRIKYGFWVVVIGLVAVVMVFVVAVAKWNTAGDVSAVVGSVTGVVGTIVGAFFGIQVGSAGKEKAENERKKAEDKALKLASHLDPGIAKNILDSFI